VKETEHFHALSRLQPKKLREPKHFATTTTFTTSSPIFQPLAATKRAQNMADRRPAGNEENGRAKRQKTNGGDMDPKANPYLAHMYDDQDEGGGGYSNGGYNGRKDDLLSGFTRHQTTAEQAKVAEDGPYNPFTGQQFSKRYLSILKTRRNLPVHAQR
jgi:hypothetical protein